ncbi:hypothetical protein JJL45_09190 [Tamlana sp. s12]|uniref:hypothetical protein n=1 Tax=Tamlana sp. s12 TaxID=1630406 RepID=UPI000800F4BA|nr:hypothetical protein [Tamlana sp. s12]OBQ52870.1 hypothetical protein VQ01_13055 [Tamlana sp. s12]QQY81104.1 hypothetical protein JJL45_09190 [Tamlana sp. s12]
MNTSTFKTVQEFIQKLAAQAQFPVDTATKLKSRGLLLRDNTEFVRAEVPATLAGEKNLLTPNGKKLAGVQTFIGQTLEKAHNQVITHARVAYGNNAASGKEASISYVNDDAAVPAGFKNADLIIRQGGKDIINLPVSDFIAPVKDGKSGYIELSGLALLKEEVPFDVIIDFPIGTDLGADKHYIEVSLKGMGTFQR